MATAATPKPKFTVERQEGRRRVIHQQYEISAQQDLADVSLEHGDTVTYDSLEFVILFPEVRPSKNAGCKIVEFVAENTTAFS